MGRAGVKGGPAAWTRGVICRAACLAIIGWSVGAARNVGAGQRQMEVLDRGMIVATRPEGGTYIGWRSLNTDSNTTGFNLYRERVGEARKQVNSAPISDSTNFIDTDGAAGDRYVLRAITSLGEAAGAVTKVATLTADRPYLAIPLRTPNGYKPNDASVGDLDGDGDYEVVLHQTGRSQDNSRAGETDPPLLEAYTLEGKFLWRIDLGRNIREGAHYTQFIVFDFDGDGRAELACKTADGTVDGVGKVLGDRQADYRNDRGYVLDGPEFLTIFDGRTGGALATTNYVPGRGRVADWGDDYGNRVDRFLACAAYLDGAQPSLVTCRGYYTRSVLAAWDWRNGKLTQRWVFDTAQADGRWKSYEGQGNHNLSVGDVDDDGRDEIVYGAMCVDDDGRGLWNTGLGHGDALHFSDLDPGRAGLEIFDIHEKARHEHGIDFRDARTGLIIWSKPSPDVGRGLALDIDPRFYGAEIWASGPGLGSLFNCRGAAIGPKPSSCNMGIWWDGDLLRELLDGVNIYKWDYENGRQRALLQGAQYGCSPNNGSKSNPCLVADILGDWREELIVRSLDNQELRIFSTRVVTAYRFQTLMQDSQYRLAVAWQNVGYNQPPHPRFYLGTPPPSHGKAQH